MYNVTFAGVLKEEVPLIEEYMPVLVKVHGENHPELAQVQEVFLKLNKKVQAEDIDQLDIAPEFMEIRQITNNYTIPKDACETYIATYEMLQAVEIAYVKYRG